MLFANSTKAFKSHFNMLHLKDVIIYEIGAFILRQKYKNSSGRNKEGINHMRQSQDLGN